MFLSSVTRTAGSERGDQTIVARDLTSSASALVAYTPFLVSASATLRSMTLPTLGPVFQISSSIGASSTAKLARRIAGETYQGRLRPGMARCLRPLHRDQCDQPLLLAGPSRRYLCESFPACLGPCHGGPVECTCLFLPPRHRPSPVHYRGRLPAFPRQNDFLTDPLFETAGISLCSVLKVCSPPRSFLPLQLIAAGQPRLCGHQFQRKATRH